MFDVNIVETADRNIIYLAVDSISVTRCNRIYWQRWGIL